MPRKFTPAHVPANYLRHMNGFISAMETDPRLKPAHVSLYVTLFGCWNRNFFVNPFVIYRQQVLDTSHIGSRDSYTKTLKELHAFGYIRYYPSAKRGGMAQVHILPFASVNTISFEELTGYARFPDVTGSPENGPDPVPETGQHSPEKGTAAVPETGRLNKHTNKTNPKNSALPPPEKQKTGLKKPSGAEEVTAWFREMRYPAAQARLFFSHYQANGWRQSNGLPIRNWQAAAEKWMLNVPNFKPNTHDNPATRLNARRQRYSDPL